MADTPVTHDAPAAGSADGHPPTRVIQEFLVAHALIRRFLPATPLSEAPELGEAHGVRVLAKHENLAPGRSFKVRGALYSVSLLSPAARAAGIVTSSTGNHAIGVAYAARAFDSSAVVIVPEDTPAIKVDQAIRLGADVRRIGANLTEAEAAARAFAADHGRRFIEDGDDPGLMVGAGTIALEILIERPETDVILVPVGGGNLIAGIASCARLLKPGVQVVGVQSSAAPAVHLSWQARRFVEAPCETFAGGLATDHPGRLALDYILANVTDSVLVEEQELRGAMATGVDVLGEVVEGAGAAGLAALNRYGERWRGATVAAVLSGGNCDSAELASRFARPA